MSKKMSDTAFAEHETRKPHAASMSHTVYQSLKEDILSFVYPAGTILQEAELAEKYGVSRTPAREALRRLVLEGIATRQGRFYAVRSFTPAEVSEIYELREPLEKMAVVLAIIRSTDDELDGLMLHLEQQDRAIRENNKQLFNRLDTQFHLEIAKLARSQLLYEQLALVHVKAMLVRSLELSRSSGMSNARNDHGRIVDAMRRRNQQAAEAEMQYHVRSVVALHHGYQEPRPPEFS